MAEKTINSRFYGPIGNGIYTDVAYELRYDPSNGNTRILSYTILGAGGIIGPNKDEVYKNGVWNRFAANDIPLKQRNEMHEKTIEVLKILKKDNRNVMPQFMLVNAPSQDQDLRSDTIVPSGEPSGGFIGDIASLFNRISENIGEKEFESENMKSIFPSNVILKYPNDIIENRQDLLKITQYSYKAPYNDVFEKFDQQKKPFELGLQRGSALKDIIASVILPVPNNATDLNGVSWADDSTSTTAMAAVPKYGVAAGALGIGAIAGLLGPVTGLMKKGAGAASAITEVSKIIGSQAGANVATLLAMGALNNPTSKAAIQSEILRRAAFDISPETILARGYGVIANSNLELLFSGPTLRQFQFGYILSPRSESEAEMCKKIIRFFKQGMAAKKSNKTGGVGTSSFLLATPNVFRLDYQTYSKDGNRKSISGMNKFKICALQNFQVSYADGQWSAYDEGQPVRYQIVFNFKEIEPIYESDYRPGSKSENNTPSVNNDDIGF
jgi:hypothetical protein